MQAGNSSVNALCNQTKSWKRRRTDLGWVEAKVGTEVWYMKMRMRRGMMTKEGDAIMATMAIMANIHFLPWW